MSPAAASRFASRSLRSHPLKFGFRNAVIFFGLIHAAAGQQNVYSRSEAGTSLWWANENPWYYQSWNSSQVRPDLPDNITRNNVFIGHNSNTSMTVNGAFFALGSLTLESGASSNRIFNASDGGGISLTGGFTNNSAGSHTFNVPIGVDGSTVSFTNNGGNVSFNGNFFLNGNTAAFGGNGTTEVSGPASGTGGSINKSGGGILVLSGTNNYSGGTTISAGTLVAGSSSALGSGSVVLNGGQLQSSGSNLTTGAMTVGGGTLQLNGTSAGTATLATGTSFSMSAGIWSLALASGVDQIVGSGIGTFSITGGTFDLGGGSINYASTYALLSGFSSGAVSGLNFTNFDSASYLPSLNTSGVLSFSAIPEPTSAFAGALIGAGLLTRRRQTRGHVEA